VLDRHGRRGWSQGARMPGRDAHGQGRKTPGLFYIYTLTKAYIRLDAHTQLNIHMCIYWLSHAGYSG